MRLFFFYNSSLSPHIAHVFLFRFSNRLIQQGFQAFMDASDPLLEMDEEDAEEDEKGYAAEKEFEELENHEQVLRNVIVVSARPASSDDVLVQAVAVGDREDASVPSGFEEMKRKWHLHMIGAAAGTDEEWAKYAAERNDLEETGSFVDSLLHGHFLSASQIDIFRPQT